MPIPSIYHNHQRLYNLKNVPKIVSNRIKTLVCAKVNCDLAFSYEKLKETSNKRIESILIQTKQRHNENPISQKLY